MQGNTPNSFHREDSPFFFMNDPKNELTALVKAAATELSRAKTQARISQKPKGIFMKNIYKDSQISFMYDFYKETDLDNMKIFLESLYDELERTYAKEGERQSLAKQNVQSSPNKDNSQIYLRMNKLQKNLLMMLNSLMKVNDNFKGYFDSQKQLFDASGLNAKERNKLQDQNTQGRKLLSAFHQIFESFDKCIRLIQSAGTDESFKEAVSPDRNTPAKNRDSSHVPSFGDLDQDIPTQKCVDTGSGGENVYTSGNLTVRDIKELSPIRRTVIGEAMTDINNFRLETDERAMIALLERLKKNVPKKKYASWDYEEEMPIMDQRLFRFLTDLERELRFGTSESRSNSPKRKEGNSSNQKLEEELEELRLKCTLMQDDLHYKTEALSNKMHEIYSLSTGVEQMRIENEQLTKALKDQRDSLISQEKVLRTTESEKIHTKDDLERTKVKLAALEKQLEVLKAESKLREQDQAYTDQISKTLREKKEGQEQLKKKNSILEKQIKDYQELRDALQRKSSKLESELEDMIRQNTQLNTEMRDLRGELKSVYELKIQLEKQNSDKINAQPVGIHDYKARYELLLRDYDRLKKFIDPLLSSYNGNDRVEHKGNDSSQLLKQIEELSAENDRLESQKTSSLVLYENRINTLGDQNYSLQQENRHLKMENGALRESNIHLEDQLHDVNANIIILANDKRILMERLKDWERSSEKPVPYTPPPRVRGSSTTPRGQSLSTGEKQYQYPLARKEQDEKHKPPRFPEAPKQSITPKRFHPVSAKNKSYTDPTPPISAIRGSLDDSYSLSVGLVDDKELSKSILTDPWTHTFNESPFEPKRHTRSISAIPQNSVRSSIGTAVPDLYAALHGDNFNRSKRSSAEFLREDPMSRLQYVSITEVENDYQREEDARKRHYQLASVAHPSSSDRTELQNDSPTQRKELEKDFRILYSVNKILKDYEAEKEPKQGPPRSTSLTTKVRKEVEHKIENLQNDLTNSTARRLIDEADTEYKEAKRAEQRNMPTQKLPRELHIPLARQTSDQATQVAHETPTNRFERSFSARTPTHEDDYYLIMAMQSNTIEQLLASSNN